MMRTLFLAAAALPMLAMGFVPSQWKGKSAHIAQTDS